MITLLSPAKTLDYESEVPISDFSNSTLLKDSKKLMRELKALAPEGIP